MRKNNRNTFKNNTVSSKPDAAEGAEFKDAATREVASKEDIEAKLQPKESPLEAPDISDAPATEDPAASSGADGSREYDGSEVVNPDELEGIDREAYERIKESMAKRKAEREARKRRPNPFKVALWVAVGIIAVMILFSTSLFDIVEIDVQGNNYFSDAEIIDMGHATIGRNLIYNPGKGEIKKYLERNPYIERATVGRRLTGTLVITVKERTQVAAILYGNEYLVIDNDGLLLRKTKTEPKLTLISGIKVTKVKEGERVEVEDEMLLNNALKLLKTMQEGDMYFTQIAMTELYIKAYIYDSLLCVGTIDDYVDTIGSERLQQVIEQLFKKGIKRGTITLNNEGYASFSPSVS